MATVDTQNKHCLFNGTETALVAHRDFKSLKEHKRKGFYRVPHDVFHAVNEAAKAVLGKKEISE